MRIVAGTAGGIPLMIPPGDLRPTMDKVRGAIFSRLADWLPGKRVVDLFAGSGSLGLEALSRGADSVVFVEKDAGAVRTMEANLAKSRLLRTRVEFLREDVFAFLRRGGGACDLVLADPPYCKREGDRDFGAELLRDAGLVSMVDSEGLLVLEVYREWSAPKGVSWILQKEKNYGESKVCYFQPVAA